MTTLRGQHLYYETKDRMILSNLSFSFQSGDWITIVGPSGSGKSTLLKLIAGLVTLSRGQILLNGQNALDYPIINYRQQVSYAPQAVRLFGQTVRDNLDLPFVVRGLKPDSASQISGLEQMVLSADYLDKPIVELSGGERQRVGVLRNLLFPPAVLLLDEISTGLDEATKTIMWAAIHRIHQKQASIVLSVTHDHDEMQQATQMMTIMADGGSLNKYDEN
jgi:putative ABC transport system ATP-binding protein